MQWFSGKKGAINGVDFLFGGFLPPIFGQYLGIKTGKLGK
jgi:hypothetical protein